MTTRGECIKHNFVAPLSRYLVKLKEDGQEFCITAVN